MRLGLGTHILSMLHYTPNTGAGGDEVVVIKTSEFKAGASHPLFAFMRK